MKTYKVFEKGDLKVAVKQGWSWPAFFFQWIWAFTKKLLLPGGVGLATNIVFALIPVKNIMNPYFLIAGIVFGLKGNKWWEAGLLKDGFTAMRTVQAKSPTDALASIPPKPEFPSINADSAVRGSLHPNAPEKKYP